jgi:hypothetical protein
MTARGCSDPGKLGKIDWKQNGVEEEYRIKVSQYTVQGEQHIAHDREDTQRHDGAHGEAAENRESCRVSDDIDPRHRTIPFARSYARVTRTPAAYSVRVAPVRNRCRGDVGIGAAACCVGFGVGCGRRSAPASPFLCGAAWSRKARPSSLTSTARGLLPFLRSDATADAHQNALERSACTSALVLRTSRGSRSVFGFVRAPTRRPHCAMASRVAVNASPTRQLRSCCSGVEQVSDVSAVGTITRSNLAFRAVVSIFAWPNAAVFIVLSPTDRRRDCSAQPVCRLPDRGSVATAL